MTRVVVADDQNISRGFFEMYVRAANEYDLLAGLRTARDAVRFVDEHETDLLILSLPGTLETEHLLNRHRLGLLPDQAAVVNVGRGSVIDQAALKAELEAGRLWAALDVFETEPLPREDSLWACSRLLLTPHVAGNMSLKSTLDEVVRLFLENLDLFREGKQLRRRVDLKKGY